MMQVVFKNSRGGGFSWLFGKEIDTPTRMPPRRPGSRDMTGGFVANEEMLRGMYHGTWKGLQFASPLCFAPVNLLVQMMGFPTPRAEGDDPVTQAVLDFILKLMADRIPRVHRGALITGTAWRWPRFDSRELSLVWEAIPDSTVTDIFVDVSREQPSAILQAERLALSVAENRVVYVERKRRFEPGRVEVKWIGQKPVNVQDYTANNVAGMLPEPFANEADEGELRGHSVFSRVIRDLKDYHDIDYRASETLAKFRVKQIQQTKNIGEWLKNNFGSSDASAIRDLDVADNDFVLNTADESTEYEYLPEGATAALEKALERKFWKVVEGTGMPELFWGPLATGNHASTDTQLMQAVDYANTKRKEFSKSWERIIAGSLRVLSVASMETYKPFEMDWNRLDGVSPSVKSEILLRFAQTASALVASASCTKKQLFKLWELNFPESDPGKYEEFIEGIGEMAQHKQFAALDYFSGLDDAQSKPKSKEDEE